MNNQIELKYTSDLCAMCSTIDKLYSLVIINHIRWRERHFRRNGSYPFTKIEILLAFFSSFILHFSCKTELMSSFFCCLCWNVYENIWHQNKMFLFFFVVVVIHSTWTPIFTVLYMRVKREKKHEANNKWVWVAGDS